jgi:hypothetical protein
MDSTRRTLLMLTLAGVVWCWSGTAAAQTPAQTGKDTLHVTMNVEGMH